MNETAQMLLLNQSMKMLEDTLKYMDEGYNKMQLQKVLDDFKCTMNNLE
jgi:hypothetical protein